MHEPITVRWLGHACFKVEKGAYSVVLDPYAPGSVPGLPDIRTDANLVLCSHGHSDHGCAEAVTLRPAQDCPFSVTKIETFHDACGGTQRGPNTIHVLEADGVRIAHFGDQGRGRPHRREGRRPHALPHGAVRPGADRHAGRIPPAVRRPGPAQPGHVHRRRGPPRRRCAGRSGVKRRAQKRRRRPKKGEPRRPSFFLSDFLQSVLDKLCKACYA